jgi:hypothetical protein
MGPFPAPQMVIFTLFLTLSADRCLLGSSDESERRGRFMQELRDIVFAVTAGWSPRLF